ncbi:hypothetical protein ACGF5O_45880 [Streptomyces sp. NPDC048291]|uniref:hypothetical protein n=1 Tax=Streptomyces sp. NPDC048291 TaxID=3365530 RepID=UPI00371F2535
MKGTVRREPDGKPVTAYRQGRNRVERPGAHHVRTENTGRTERAERAGRLVAFVADTGDGLRADDPKA